jgi:ribonuclease HIII
MVSSAKPAHKVSIASPAERSRIKHALQGMPEITWTEKAEQNCQYRLDGQPAAGGWLRAKQFTNGTLYLEASSDDLLAAMCQAASIHAPSLVSTQSRLPLNGQSRSTTQAPVEAGAPRGKLAIEGTYIGTDESGKGDYFGPLVIAGVLVTETTIPKLAELGVMDSKKLTDKIIANLASEIVAVVGQSAVSVVEIGPQKYNELYNKFKSGGRNLNHLLAWGHARVIENLLSAHPDCHQAVADQFGSEHYILSMLQEKGQQIKLYQTPKAEANIGVAAASIIARHRFVQKLSQLATQFATPLPPGANPQVKTAARAVIARHGRDALAQVAKLHFKTTQEL